MPSAAAAAPGASQRADANDPLLEAALVSKFNRRVLPLLAMVCMVAWMDRQNVAFAKLQMADDLGMSEYAYGLGASLFFLSYTLFQLPNSLMIAKVGPVRWFAPAAICWGIATIGLAASSSVQTFYVLRFLLGVVEAGFYTGSIYLLTLWLPYSRRAQANGVLLGAGLAANILTGPICGVMLDLDLVLGLRGWQWVFIATGLPSLLIGVAIPFLLPRDPSKARFLTDAERNWLAAQLAAERSAHPGHSDTATASVSGGLRNPIVPLIALPVFTIGMGSIGIVYWLPTIVAGFGVSNTVNGFLNSLPWIAVVAALAWWPRRAERLDERYWHSILPLAVAAVSALLVPIIDVAALQFLLLTICTVGIFAAQPIIWSLPGRLLRGSAVAAVLAIAGTMANIGAFAAQNIIPWIAQTTNDARAPMFFVAAMLAMAAISTGVLIRRSETGSGFKLQEAIIP